jgi:uncharacterized protein
LPKALRLVLDTHIALEAYVWDSPRHSALRQAQEDQRIVLLASAATLQEFALVLRYPKLKLADAAQTQALARYSALLMLIDTAQVPDTLPRCRDVDDQKFLSLAYAGAADLLLTRDKKLRKIARNQQYRARFQTLDPDQEQAQALISG